MTARHPHGIAMASARPEDEGTNDKRQRAAERVRRHRERKRNGSVVALVEVTPDIRRWLVAKGWIAKGEEEDREKLGYAVADALWTSFRAPKRD